MIQLWPFYGGNTDFEQLGMVIQIYIIKLLLNKRFNDFKNSFTFFISNDIDIKKISSKKNLELKDKHIKKIKVGIREDICINGLGFIKVIDPCEINIYIDKDIDVYTRKSLI